MPATEAAPAESASSQLPEDLIKIPAIQAILAGSPPAVSATVKDFTNTPEGKTVASNVKPLMDAGFGLYRSLSGDMGVLFNRMYVTDQEVMEADKAGKLSSVAPSFDEVNNSVKSSGKDHPILSAKPPSGFKSPGVPSLQAPTITPPETVKPASAKTIVPKLNALKPKGPTSGPSPGAGRLLNNILKPVI